MNYYFITGSSKGLGRALLDLLLKDENNFIYGLARTCPLEHERYSHKSIDLSELSKVEEFDFSNLENPECIILINNAGMIGDVNRVGKLDTQKVIDCYNLNLIAPVILTNNFISKYERISCDKIVLNISSGAGRAPIDGWNVYCSTKAGLDMFSEVFNEEVNIDKSNVKVLSLAPGIIDTGMQGEIRTSKQSAFSNVERFINYKKNGELIKSIVTARQVLRFIKEKGLQKEVLCSVRDL